MDNSPETHILRKAKKKNFTIIDNQIFQNTYLSWKAKGILCYLLSLPDDWRICKKHLVKQSSDGKESFQSGWNELRNLGYLSFHQGQNSNGKIAPGVWTVHEEPILDSKNVYADRVSRTPVFPDAGFPAPTNTNPNQVPKELNSASAHDMFGDFVKLKKGDYEQICQEHGKILVDDIIEDINLYCAQKGPYKSYKAAFERFLKNRKANPKAPAKNTFKDEVLKRFKHDSLYNGATCYIDQFSIAFERGMKNKAVKFSEHGFQDQFQNLLREFGITWTN